MDVELASCCKTRGAAPRVGTVSVDLANAQDLVAKVGGVAHGREQYGAVRRWLHAGSHLLGTDFVDEDGGDHRTGRWIHSGDRAIEAHSVSGPYETIGSHHASAVAEVGVVGVGGGVERSRPADCTA